MTGIASVVLTHEANAQSLNIVFDNATQFAVPGSTISFAGKITNTSASSVTILGDEVITDDPLLTSDDSPFFSQIPATGLVIASGATFPFSGSTSLFNITVAAATPLAQNYTGRFRIEGDPSLTQLGIAGYKVVTIAALPTPEPSTMTATLLGLVMIGGIRFATRRRKAD